MPTTGCAEAFTRLLAARERLRHFAREMNRARKNRHVDAQAAAEYEAVQAEWEAARQHLKVVTARFSMTVRKVGHEDGSGKELSD